MPWIIKPHGTEFWIYKQDTTGKSIGEPVGKHKSRTKAKGQLRALYANVPDARKETAALIVNNFSEAATLKAKIQGLIRDAEDILDDKDVPGAVRSAVSDVRNAMKRTWSDLKDESQATKESDMPLETAISEVMKTIGGETFPASDFLVVEKSDEPSTWHLQVKKHGKVDHRLMGAAKAALTAPGGHRGNKYEGPDKQKAISALKKMYDMEQMMWESAIEEDYSVGDRPIEYVATWGATSFADLDAAKEAKDAAGEVQVRIQELNQLFSNILTDELIEDKPAALKKVTDEFIALVTDIFANPSAESAEQAKSNLKEGEVLLSESVDGGNVTLEESNMLANDKRAPLYLNVRLIKPGLGNKRDKNFYPADILKRDAHIFEGAKMYTTDHRAGEKSERTEVSVIEKIMGFTGEGAPLARVAVFDPDFAEKTRNRAELGKLDSLECSILAGGISKPGKLTNGDEANIVEAITSVSSVDWVTKAGAGGAAVNISESEGGTMPEPTELKPEDKKNETQTKVQPAPAATTEKPAEQVATTETAKPQIVNLSEAEVSTELDKSNLPKGIKELVAAKPYAKVEELKEAIATAVKTTKELTASGKPWGVGDSQASSSKMTSEEYEKRLAETYKRYGVGG